MAILGIAEKNFEDEKILLTRVHVVYLGTRCRMPSTFYYHSIAGRSSFSRCFVFTKVALGLSFFFLFLFFIHFFRFFLPNPATTFFSSET